MFKSMAPTDLFSWQQSRRKAGAAHVYPLTGFGGGPLTLYAPDPAEQARMVIRGGQPVWESGGSLPEELQALRAEVVRSIQLEDISGRMTASTAFVRYAVGLLRLGYTLTDDELTAVMAGTKWHQSVAEHLIGGESGVEFWLKQQIAPAAEPVAAGPEPVVRKGYFGRLWDALCGRQA